MDELVLVTSHVLCELLKKELSAMSNDGHVPEFFSSSFLFWLFSSDTGMASLGGV